MPLFDIAYVRLSVCRETGRDRSCTAVFTADNEAIAVGRYYPAVFICEQICLIC